VTFLAAKSSKHKLANSKSSFADIQRNIEERIFRDTLANRPKIESNYPATDVTFTMLQTVLGWPGNRAEVMAMLDAIIHKATAVDGVTGEKGIAGYTTIGPRGIADLLGRYMRSDPGFIREALRRHPRLHAMYRFHLDTWCLGQYYPRTGDTGWFAGKNDGYVGVSFSRNSGINPSAYAFLWELYEATGDKDFVRVLHGANGASTKGFPYDLFAVDPVAFQAGVAKVIADAGAEIKLPSVNKAEWGLAILRSGEGTNARAVWLDYDSGGGHGHADGMTIGLFAKGLDLLPDFGYPPVQFGGWTAPRALWYLRTAAHNTVAVDGKDTKSGSGKTTLWFEGGQFRTVRASGPKLSGGQQYERTIALVDVSAQDSYLIDVFRVAGGSEHTRFLHGHYGHLTADGLSLVPVAESRYGEIMRGFRRDSKPATGWSVDWKIANYLKYLPAVSDLHLRHTDLTRDVQVDTAESWVAVGLFGGTAEAWIPSVLTRRRAAKPPLISTFVGVLEPYADKSNITAIRRLDIQDANGKACSESDVGIEIQLADGSRDVFLSRNVEGQTATSSALVVDKESGLRFEGDLCLIRFDRAKQPQRVVLCRGKSLRVGNLKVGAKGEDTSFEVNLNNRENPVVAGSAEAVALIEVAGVKVFPR
jgi:hypothetical protein